LKTLSLSEVCNALNDTSCETLLFPCNYYTLIISVRSVHRSKRDIDSRVDLALYVSFLSCFDKSSYANCSCFRAVNFFTKISKIEERRKKLKPQTTSHNYNACPGLHFTFAFCVFRQTFRFRFYVLWLSESCCNRNVSFSHRFFLLITLPIESIRWKRLGFWDVKLRFPKGTSTIYHPITADLANRTKPVASAPSIFDYSLSSLFTFS